MINDTKMTLTLGNIMVKNSTLKSSHHSEYCQQNHQANTTHQLYYPAVLLLSHSFPSLMLQQTMSVFKVHQRDSHAPPHTHRRFFKNLQSVFVRHDLAAVALSNVSQKLKAAPPK